MKINRAFTIKIAMLNCLGFIFFSAFFKQKQFIRQFNYI